MDHVLEREKEHLEQIKQIAIAQTVTLEAAIAKDKDEILGQKYALREESQHAISASLWSSDGFEELVELSQQAAQTSDAITVLETRLRKVEQLKKLIQRPYFARVDFRFDDDGSVQPVYIGRHPLMDEDAFEWLVFDWRAPISSLFYRYGLGQASYEAPGGDITGDVLLKRQYEITDGQLAYYFDADMQILDDFLRQMLAHNTSPQMKSIVETIQKDQDLIIRNMACDLLMVQGVAGSGKTSVALHRVAYLMYHGLSQRLGSHDIVILSPNTLFESYISQVLPELGEESVRSYVFDDLYDMILDRPFETKHQLYEALLDNTGEDPELRRAGLSYKMSSAFIATLQGLCIPEGANIDTVIAHYRELFSRTDCLETDSAPQDASVSLETVRRDTLEGLGAGLLRYEDASAAVYLYLKCHGYNAFHGIRHVVVDEAQDYYPIQFEIMKLLFPRAQYTVLGDVHQTIGKHEQLSFYDLVGTILAKKNTTLVSLEKSFRCAQEILAFSSRFIDRPIQSFSRHCAPPRVVARAHSEDLAGLLEEINACHAEGHRSVAILCKSGKDARHLHNSMPSQMDARLVEGHTEAALTGLLILPVYLAKGLEFDAVIVWDVDSARYGTQEERQLLYIACTRALHRLTLFYEGMLSPLCLGR